MSSETVAAHAADTLASLRELCSSSGIKLGEVTDREIARFVQESNTKDDGYFCATEFQELVTRIAKYAALKARRHPRARWTLGMALSAAGAVAVSAVLPAAAASAGLLVAAAPVGAAVGAVALSLDGRSMPRRDRRRATRHVPRKNKAAAPAAAAEISTAEHNSTVVTAAAPAGPAESAEPQLAASSSSDELISAVVEVGSAADSPAKAQPAPAASAFAAAAATAAEPAEPAVLLPELARCATPDAPSSTAEAEAAASTEDSVPQPGTPGSDIDAAAFDGAVSAGLPPLAVKPKGKDQKDQKPVSSTKALKKGLSKSFKSMKKAFSMNSSGSSSLRSSLDIASPNASITTPSNARPPLPTSGAAAFLRRSFSRDSRDVAGVADKDGSLIVQPSEGSATLRKMREALRRSFTISTPRGGSRRASVDAAF
ncbi:hypothetical protein OEZ85_012127 [Tetradesmus obliquus]|uniref:EF-hand domain-containing protein n=1 Tax=Tetradesmus obliquus TaxID=3088 RepID=A0ABY8TX60_TETOB|nr:hypothetical protein OEZ85_012127 [Tetradesmus obliquus]